MLRLRDDVTFSIQFLFSIRVSSLGSSYIVSHKLRVLLTLGLVSRYSIRNALIYIQYNILEVR